jgi:undecaprenyl diphosphate synthase
MNDIKQLIDIAQLPRHIAIIMDGNGRWAKEKGQPRVFGHRNGVKAVRESTEAAAELGVEYMTLYAFSTENWNRPKLEVDALMTLLVDTLAKEIKTLNKNNIRLQAVGDLGRLPDRTRKALLDGIASTSENKRMTLVLALNYSGKWDILQAAQKLATQVQHGLLKPEEIDDALFSQQLATANIPDPELLIRTSGENRLSNFLLWQLAYAEFCFLPVFWPDFTKEHLYKAILDYQRRERRFGMVSEQLLK